MLKINYFKISNDYTKMFISVSTGETYQITGLKLWNHDTFKDYSQAIDLSPYIDGQDETETFTVYNDAVLTPEGEIILPNFKGIWFLEVETDMPVEECGTCENLIIGIAANLNEYREYLLDLSLRLSVCDDFTKCNQDMIDRIINLSLILESLCIALSSGYYEEAIMIYKKLYKMFHSFIGSCDVCNQLKRYPFKSGCNFCTEGNQIVVL